MRIIPAIYDIISYFFPIDNKKIVIINGKDKVQPFDIQFTKKIYEIDSAYTICKVVDFNENIDFKAYPTKILLSGKNTLLAKKDLATAKVIIDMQLSAVPLKHKKSQFYISLPTENDITINKLASINKAHAKKYLDFCICHDKKMFTALTAAFSNCVQLLQYGDPRKYSIGSPVHNRFVKFIALLLSSREKKHLDLFRRINIKKERYTHIGIYHNYFGFIYCINNNCLRKFLKIKYGSPLLNFVKYLYKIIFKYLPIKKNRIVLRNFQHKYGDNPKYITEELLKRNKNYDIIWIVDLKKNSPEHFPQGITIRHNNTFRSWLALYTAAIWIDNNVRAVNPVKKKGQFFVQTWHGSLGIKKFDNVWPQSVIDENNLITDVCISNSKFETNVYKNTIWKDVEIKEFGHPRNDILFASKDKENILKEKIFDEYGIEKNTKILLYAPTFRDEHLYGSQKDKSDFSMYLEAYDDVRYALEKRFGGTWIIFERLHYHIKNCMRNIQIKNVIDVSKYDDMQELIFISDIAITDYSSWIYDFALTKRPGFIFAKDKEHYLTQRELYFPLESGPYPVAYSTHDLVDNIVGFDEEKFKNDIEIFLKNKGCIEDGLASERVVDLIDNIIK